MKSDEDIESIRTSLGLDARVEEEVHRAGERLVGEIDGWVERFYVRLVGDPVAMRVLGDEGRIVRLKRSLAAWFAELFALPFDAAYERAREQIGRTHVRIAMPQHLMVTAMNGIRQDVVDSIARIWGDDIAGARRAAGAVEKALDLELALMLAAYRRRSRELRQQAERSLLAAYLERRLSAASHQAIDAARCYAELADRASSEEERAGRLALLSAVLDGIARPTEPVAALDGDRVRVALRPLCARALAEVSLPERTWLDLTVEPPDLEADVRPDALEIVLQDIVQRAVHRAAGGAVLVSVCGVSDAVRIDVAESGSGRPDEGASQSLGGSEELVAKLHGGTLEPFRDAGGGVGVRMWLPGAVRADRD